MKYLRSKLDVLGERLDRLTPELLERLGYAKVGEEYEKTVGPLTFTAVPGRGVSVRGEGVVVGVGRAGYVVAIVEGMCSLGTLVALAEEIDELVKATQAKT